MGMNRAGEEVDADLALVRQAAAGDRAALGDLIARLTPVVQARVARCLLRGQRADIRRDVEDFTQDVLLALLEDDVALLQRWEPERGLSLKNFTGLVAERMVISKLRSGRHNPWREEALPTDEVEAVSGAMAPVGPQRGEPVRELASADVLQQLLLRLQEELSPQGYHLFDLLYVQEASVKEVCAGTGLSSDAVYAWRSRLRRTASALYRDLMSDLPA